MIQQIPKIRPGMAQSPSRETEPKVKIACVCVSEEIFILRKHAFAQKNIDIYSFHFVQYLILIF